MSALTPDQLREHPQLAVLMTLLSLLSVAEPALVAVHIVGDQSAPAEQARSILRVMRILQHQVDAYRGLLAVGDGKPAARPPARGRAG